MEGEQAPFVPGLPCTPVPASSGLLPRPCMSRLQRCAGCVWQPQQRQPDGAHLGYNCTCGLGPWRPRTPQTAPGEDGARAARMGGRGGHRLARQRGAHTTALPLLFPGNVACCGSVPGRCSQQGRQGPHQPGVAHVARIGPRIVVVPREPAPALQVVVDEVLRAAQKESSEKRGGGVVRAERLPQGGLMNVCRRGAPPGAHWAHGMGRPVCRCS